MDEYVSRNVELIDDPKFQEMTADFVSDFSQISDPIMRAQTINSIVDQVITHIQIKNPDLFKTSPCKNGCAHCCHILLSISSDELDLIMETIEDKKITIDYPHLVRQAEIIKSMGEHTSTNAKRYLKISSYDERRCIFLDENKSCKIYENRPLACRSYFIFHENSDICCTKNQLHQVPVLHSPLISAIGFAAAIVTNKGPDAMGMLAVKVLERLLKESSNVNH